MADRRPNEEEIFKTAHEIRTPEARASYIDLACGGDAALKERVIALLRVTEEEASFLESPAAALADTIAPAPLTERPGAIVGAYKLLQQIGEGGFGVVYMAEQTEPVRRKVALKIIKPGMDTKEVVARFEAERQALALMDHPNIARVLDAGATESGRPYFVMELVKGVPIIEYCDRNHLPASERLKLFVDVCHAIQHAHQKGVIHRDLKPSNIMVTLHDGKPVPKVIDFGVSKALSQQLTEKTLFTAYGQMVGTPAYMSPEQAEMSGLDIDTRSDVYSLGVLLYELLTGGTPFDKQRLREAGYAEMQRIIREEEPPKPSTRLTTLGEQSAVVSQNRGTDARKLGQLVRGDLDWIVMKALDKERNRRYETANGFAADVERFLADEPVVACPPSAAYRFRKFTRRNRGPMAVATIATIALMAAAIGSMVAAGRFRNLAERNADLVLEKEAALTTAVEAEEAARDAQQEAEDARDKEEDLRIEAERQTQIATDALGEAEDQRERAQANFALARSAVDQFLNQVAENELLTVPGLHPLREELLSSAMEFYDSFTEDEANAGELQVELARAHHRIARIRGELGQKEQSRAANDKSIELYEQLRDGGNNSTDVRIGLAQAYFRRGRYDDVVSLCEEILQDDEAHPETRSLLSETYNSLAISEKNDDNIAAALSYHQQALTLREGLVQDFPDNSWYVAGLGSTVNNLGVLLAKQGQNREAQEMFERAVGYSAEAYSKSPQTIMWGRWLCIGLRNVANKQKAFGDQEAALTSFERAVAVRRKLAFENPAVPSLKGELHKAWIDLGNYQRALGRAPQANRSFRAAREVLENVPRNSPDEMFELAVVYGALAQPFEGAADEPEEEEQEERRQNEADAMQWLQKSIDAGYRNVKVVQTHKSLDPLRERQDFQQLVVWLNAEVLGSTDVTASDQTLADRREALAELRELIADDPDDLRLRTTLAAMLTSIGHVQIGMKQYAEAEESLRESLQVREALFESSSDKPEAEIDILNTRYALGRLFWDSDRFPEAHQIWQPVMAELETLSTTHQENPEILNAAADVEQRICDRYGRLGLWELAAPHVDRNVRYDRVLNRNRDAWCSIVLPLIGKTDEYREFSHMLAQRYEQSESVDEKWRPWELASLALQGSLVPDPAVPAERLVAIAREALETEPDTKWLKLTLTLALYRNSQHKTVLDQLGQERWGKGETPSEDRHHWIVAAYVRAMALVAQHQPEEAIRVLNAAEECYRQFCRETLAGSDLSFPAPIGRNWWWFAFPEQLRREAWQKVRGKSAPDDPWQHLIQARAYRIIGEDELAESELAAAASAAVGNDEATQAHLQLRDRWDQIAHIALADQLTSERHAEEELRELIGSDPSSVRHRGTLAAALHSIGLIEAGLGNHEAAEKSFREELSLRESSREVKSGGDQDDLSLAAVYVALGDVLWKSRRIAQAIENWNKALDLLSTENLILSDQSALRLQVVDLERTIYRRFGEIGLWERVCEYVERNLQRGHTTDGYWDLRIAHVYAAVGREDEHADVCRVLAEKWSESRPNAVLWSVAMNPEPVLEVSELLALAQKVVDSREDRKQNFSAAIAYYRAGRFEKALDLMLKGRPRDFVVPAYRYWYAMVDYQLGDKEQSERMFDAAESAYLEFAEKCLRSPAASAVQDGHGGYWFTWAEDQAMRRQAWNVLKGQDPPEDPWQHLIQARAYRLIGEDEAADAELAAAEIAAPDDRDVLTARVRLLEQWQADLQATEVAWQRVVDLAVDDPMPWIGRGRWYAEQGEHEKADADFAKAASLTPDELNKFLEAGWWVVGPYPENLDEFCPPEIDPDPSKSVHVINPSTGLSVQPIAWRSVQTGVDGLINPANLPDFDAGSHYALAYVFSAETCCRFLRVSKSPTEFRVWVNGVESGLRSNRNSRIPIVLQSGRNTILFRCIGKCRVNLGDSAVDRALTFLDQGRWSDVADVVRDQVRPDNPDRQLISNLAMAVAAAGDEQTYNELANRLIDRARADFALYGICQRPGPAFGEHAERLVSLAEEFALPATNDDKKMLAALVNYRAGRLERAQYWLDQVSENSHTYDATLVIRALVASGKGNAGVAKSYLSRAQERFEAITDGEGVLLPGRARGSFDWPNEPAQLCTLLCEAEREILGSDVDMLGRLDEFESRQRKFWDERDPELWAFDLAIRTELFSQANQYLARGRRLADLGRVDDAEADFNKAVEVASGDADVLIARARFFADRDSTDRAAADFDAALTLHGPNSSRSANRTVRIMAQYPNVWEAVRRIRPHERRLWHGRGEYHALQGLWDEAAADFDQATAVNPNATRDNAATEYAALKLLSGDDGGYLAVCRQVADTKTSYKHAGLANLRTWLLSPDGLPEAERRSDEVEKILAGSSDSWTRHAAGLFQFRQGNFAESIAILNDMRIHKPQSLNKSMMIWSVLAMAEHRLGNAHQAQKWLRALDAALQLSNDPALVSADVGTVDWLYSRVLYREAKRLVEGPEALAMAEAEQASRQGTLREGFTARAEAAWQRVVDLAGDDPMPWIQRGRWYAERGKHDKADADFTKAASLTPDELNKFLEAGWWVVGPYPANLDEFCPPEIDPDPSRAVHVIDPKTGLSEVPVSWNTMAAGVDGLIDLPSLAGKQSKHSVYLTAYVYSPDERTELVRVGEANGIRVWWNGQPVLQTDQRLGERRRALRIPVTLRRGRNQILIRTHADRALTVIWATARPDDSTH